MDVRDLRMDLVDKLSAAATRDQEAMWELVAPLGFDSLHRPRNVQSYMAMATFLTTEHGHKRLVRTIPIETYPEGATWQCGNPQNGWTGPVFDNPEVAFVAAELANWGRTSEERDYSRSSEV